MKYVYNKFIETLCCKRTILHSKGCSCVDNDSLYSDIKRTILNWRKTIILWKGFTEGRQDQSSKQSDDLNGLYKRKVRPNWRENWLSNKQNASNLKFYFPFIRSLQMIMNQWYRFYILSHIKFVVKLILITSKASV
jgi:hypothetical protein